MFIGSQAHLIKNALDASSMRQEMISSNIANVNTPGYKAKRVEFEDVLKRTMDGSGMRGTHERHFGSDDLTSVRPEIRMQKGNRINENGNNVAIDTEMAELSANAIYYQALTTQLSNQYGTIRSVLR
ncbi:Flagellar basal-body rod protein FlgB [Alkalibacterium sp. AK22]|uniref:flagellar basal body rod protein FlgB n=1 Tax=Alkalibacterium sp. AK22 TaxID=1229520 RepID=UPI000449CE20|nr:flagellar basal body rod protein FlgB [Alkalibacterium sp. AK22]EXJ22378.1 Flagellar basal-body rod protein FlgB [Alkalibacterium sp. AK22]